MGDVVEKRVLRGTRQYQIEEKSLLVLRYYLITKPISEHENYYGIEINQEKITEGVDNVARYNRLLLSSSEAWIEELMDKFIGNGVTPDTMTYIIDDIMGTPC